MTDHERPVNTLSPDGRYAWNGHDWVPVQTTPAWPPQPSGSYGLLPPQTGPSIDPYAATWPVAEPPPPRVRDLYAWLLALVPLVIFVVAFVIGFGIGVTGGDDLSVATVWSGGVGVGLSVACAIFDVKQMKAKGYKASYVLALLLPFVYLFVRAARLRRGWAIAIVGVVLAVLSVVANIIVFLSLAPTEIDAGLLETTIEQSVQDQVGIEVDVTCPEHVPIEVGSSFQCELRDSTGGVDLAIDVDIVSELGDVTWQVRQP